MCKEMTQPVVSVIMASYNSAPYVASAVYSVLKQSIAEIELIVIDDASTDASPEIIHNISEIDKRVRLMKAPKNSGPAAARNLGLEHVRGRWVAIMDSDDLMMPDRLERMIAHAEEDKVDIVADNPLLFWDDRSSAPELHIDLSEPIVLNLVELMNGAEKYGYLKPVFRSARLGHIRYNENLFVGEDFDYYMRAMLTGAGFKVYPITGYLYRRHKRLAPNARHRRNAEGMLASNIAFRREFAESGPLFVACKKREAELQSIINYLLFVDLLKEKRFMKSIAFGIKNPSCVRRLHRPIKAALVRLKGLSRIKPTTPAKLSDMEASIDQVLLDMNGFGERLGDID
jgi:succinoglycan biosynthesis protein ExoO